MPHDPQKVAAARMILAQANGSPFVAHEIIRQETGMGPFDPRARFVYAVGAWAVSVAQEAAARYGKTAGELLQSLVELAADE